MSAHARRHVPPPERWLHVVPDLAPEPPRRKRPPRPRRAPRVPERQLALPLDLQDRRGVVPVAAAAGAEEPPHGGLGPATPTLDGSTSAPAPTSAPAEQP